MSLGGREADQSPEDAVMDKYPAINCSIGGEEFLSHIDCGANVSAINGTKYALLPTSIRDLRSCSSTWSVAQADKSELTVVGWDKLKVNFQGGGDLDVELLVIKGLAADVLLGTDFMDRHDVCFTTKEKATGLKQIVFGETGWSFPFVRGYRDQQNAVANFIMARVVSTKSPSMAGRINLVQERLEDETLGVMEDDSDLQGIPEEIEEEVESGEDHFLGPSPLHRGGQGREAT
jgi:hypothetical protein